MNVLVVFEIEPVAAVLSLPLPPVLCTKNEYDIYTFLVEGNLVKMDDYFS